MILRKPYAFLAKHFKKIHIILTILVAYLVYRTNLLLQFFNECVTVEQNMIGQDLTGRLFNVFMFIIPFLWILLSVIILSLMVTKKKPITFYIINIVMAIVILVLYTYSNNVVLTMQTRLVDIRILRALRDIMTFVFFAQFLVTCMVAVRATGFDIKKFNFVEDLAGIQVEEQDREEFEVNLEVDTDKTKRDFKRNLRYAKYVYVENMYLINAILGLVVTITCFVIFMNIFVYNKTYKTGESFSIAGFNMKIENAYIVTKDSKRNKITEDGKSLIVLDLAVRKTINRFRTLDKASAILYLGDHKFYPNETYRDKLSDLGKVYSKEEITKDVNDYLLVYEVPTGYLNKKMSFEYADKNTIGIGIKLQKVKVKLKAKSLETEEKTIEIKKENDIQLKESILKDSTLRINSVDINSKFLHVYDFCPRKNECYRSTEYIKPDILNSYDKTLLRIDGSFIKGEKSDIQKVSNLYDFISLVGKIEYTQNGTKKVQKVAFKEVKPAHNRNQNIYYVEVLKEIEQAEEVELVFYIRGVSYRYRIK